MGQRIIAVEKQYFKIIEKEKRNERRELFFKRQSRDNYKNHKKKKNDLIEQIKGN